MKEEKHFGPSGDKLKDVLKEHFCRRPFTVTHEKFQQFDTASTTSVLAAPQSLCSFQMQNRESPPWRGILIARLFAPRALFGTTRHARRHQQP